jgi:hypothetical protein
MISGVKVRWSSASYMHYAGFLIVLSASVALLGSLSDDYDEAAFFGWSILVALVSALLTITYWSVGRRVAAGLLSFVTLILLLVCFGAFEDWIGLLDADGAPISGFNVGRLLLYLAAIFGGLFFIAIFRFPLLVTVVVLGAWLFVVDLLSGGGDWSAVVSIFVGLFFLLVGAAADRTYGFWVHIGAGLALGGAFLYIWHSKWWEWLLIGIIALFFFAFAAGLDRSSYAVFASLGLFLMSSYFIERWVGSDTFPFTLFDEGEPASHPWARALLYTLVGLIFLAIGLWFERTRRASDQLDDSLTAS